MIDCSLKSGLDGVACIALNASWLLLPVLSGPIVAWPAMDDDCEDRNRSAKVKAVSTSLSATALSLLDWSVFGLYGLCVSGIYLSEPNLCAYRAWRYFFLQNNSAIVSELLRMSITVYYLLGMGEEFGFTSRKGI